MCVESHTKLVFHRPLVFGACNLPLQASQALAPQQERMIFDEVAASFRWLP